MSSQQLFFPDPRGRDYSEAVVVGELAFISGQTALDEEDRVVGPGDFEAQLRRTFANLERALERCDSTLDRVVKLTVHFKAIADDYPTFVRIRREILRPPFPASTGVQCELMLPELLIEIEAVAVVGAAGPTARAARP